MPAPKSTGEYSFILDCLRVLAMLGVLAVHVTAFFPFPEIVSNVFAFGRRGVQVFFALSAYLGCSYFFRPNGGTLAYYKRRALRILPTYYAAIIAAMVYVECFAGGSVADAFHLGWLRYFLGLNTILPSYDFNQWNNSMAFWSMTNFIAFYLLAPLIFKFVRTYKSSIIFLIICVILALICKTCSKQIPADYFSEIRQLIKWTPLGQLQHFALGICAFFAMREKKIKPTVIALILIAAVSTRSEMLGSALGCLAILLVRDGMVSLGKRVTAVIKFVAHYSFHVYLTHWIALSAATLIVTTWLGDAYPAFYWVKFALVFVIVIALCTFLELAQRLANWVFSHKGAQSSNS